MNASLPTEVRQAPLPVSYEQARTALRQCEKIDECKEWADKAQALASYAKQANDESMLDMARRIQARALERCGELLMEKKAQGKRSDLGEAGPISRKEAAQDAGLSPDQAKDAIRIASIPQQQRDELIESAKPPTVTELAQIGTKKRPVEPQHPYRDQYLKWMIATQNLAKLPDCGLAGITTHPLALVQHDSLVASAKAAIANLEDWLIELQRLKERENADANRVETEQAI